MNSCFHIFLSSHAEVKGREELENIRECGPVSAANGKREELSRESPVQE